MTLPSAILQQQEQYVYLSLSMCIWAGETADKLHWLFKTPNSPQDHQYFMLIKRLCSYTHHTHSSYSKISLMWSSFPPDKSWDPVWYIFFYRSYRFPFFKFTTTAFDFAHCVCVAMWPCHCVHGELFKMAETASLMVRVFAWKKQEKILQAWLMTSFSWVNLSKSWLVCM